MRALCVGDLHLGAGPDLGRDPATDRLADQEAVWDTILNKVAVAYDVDAVLFAGDAFHRRRPTPAVLRAFQRPLRRFREDTGIEVVAINGNHDVESAALPSALELFDRDAYVHSTPGLVKLPGGVTIATLPWTPIGRLVAAQNGGDRGEIDVTGSELLVRAARDLRDQVAGQCVLMLHWSVSGASVPNGLEVGPEFGIALDPDALASIGFDAIVCGHIHKAQSFHPELGFASVELTKNATVSDQGTPFFYTGSPLPVDFGEATTLHGVWILDLAEVSSRSLTAGQSESPGEQLSAQDERGLAGVTTATFVPIESRPLVTHDLDLTTHDGIFSLASLPPVTDAIVRVRVRATEEQIRRYDFADWRRELYEQGAHKVYAIQPDIVRENRQRIEHVDEDITTSEAAGMYADAVALTAADRESLLELTGRYSEKVDA